MKYITREKFEKKIRGIIKDTQHIVARYGLELTKHPELKNHKSFMKAIVSYTNHMNKQKDMLHMVRLEADYLVFYIDDDGVYGFNRVDREDKKKILRDYELEERRYI